MNKPKDALWQLLPIAMVLISWEISVRLRILDPILFPKPSHILDRTLELVVDLEFLRHFGSSLLRLTKGLAIAIPLGICTGIYSEALPRFGAILRPWIYILYPIPKIAIFPLLIPLLGIGDGPKIAIIAIGAYFLIFLSTAQGARRLLDSPYMDTVKVFQISRFDFHYRIMLKGVIPEILSGIKAGSGYAWIMVIAGEFMMSNRGLGVFIWTAWDQFRIPDLYAGLAVLSVSGFLTFSIIDRFSKERGIPA